MNYKKLRIPVHIIFWILVLIFYTLFFGTENRDYARAFRFVIVLLPITIATTYFLNYYLIPVYLLKKRYFRFFLFFLYTLVISITLELNAVMFSLIGVFDFEVYLMTPASFNIFYLIAANYLVVFLAIAVKLLNKWYQIQHRNLLLEKEGMEIELKLKEAELKLLKAQIHPHFLFNTLNNLYGLSLSGSKQAPEMVLKISSLLDFMLYKSTKSHVTLEEEIEYIKDYIDLEKLRYKKLDLTFEQKGSIKDLKIAPMLLQPFIENAFKHGVSKEKNNGWIKIKLSADGPVIHFKVHNSKTSHDQMDPSGYTEGIGLKNVERRLKILYPGKHDLTIRNDKNEFEIDLTLDLTSIHHENKVSDR